MDNDSDRSSDNETKFLDDQRNDDAAVDTGGSQMTHSVEHRPSSPMRLSVSGISRRTTKETFANYFRKFGEVVDSVIKKKKKTKIYGFVTFADSAVADKVLKEKHVIDNRKIKLKRRVPRDVSKTKQKSVRGNDDASDHHRVHEEQIQPLDNEVEIFDDQRNDDASDHHRVHEEQIPPSDNEVEIFDDQRNDDASDHHRVHEEPPFADSAVAEKELEEEHVIDDKKIELVSPGVSKTRQIYVRVLPPPLEEDELKNYFCQYGDIIKHEIMYDGTGRSKGFGYVTFQTEDSVDRLFSEGKIHNLGDKQVEITREGPKKTGKDNSFQSYGASSENDQEDCYGGEENEDYNMYSGYGAYGAYVRNYMGNAAGFYGGGGAYGYGGPMLNPGYGGPMLNPGYGVGPYSHMGGGPSGYGVDAYGGGNSGSSSGRRNRTNGSKPARYHPYRK